MSVLSDLKADVDKLNTDVYVGDGPENLSITTRLALLEDGMQKFDKLFWAVIIMLIAIVGDLIKHHT